MFKKGKKSKQSQDTLGLEDRKDRRRFFRIEPDPSAPVFLADDSRKYRVEDVSAGGVAFEAESFASGRECRGRLYLPGVGSTQGLTLRVVRQVRQRIVGAEIVEIAPEDRDLIHVYVLERQKELLKRSRT